MNFRFMALTLASLGIISSPGLAAEITLHGSTTVSANLIEPHKAEIESKSGHTLNVVANGSSNGIKGVSSGAAQIGMISAPMEDVVAKVNKKEPGAADASALQAVQVGEARVAFTVHSSNTVKELTLEQVTNILNGTTKSWKDLGGADTPILVIAEVSGGGLRTIVEDELLGKTAISANKRELPNGTQIAKVVAQVPSAFGVMSAGLVDSTVVEVKTDKPIAQPLILVTKGAPSAEAQAVIDAAKELGGM